MRWIRHAEGKRNKKSHEALVRDDDLNSWLALPYRLDQRQDETDFCFFLDGRNLKISIRIRYRMWCHAG